MIAAFLLVLLVGASLASNHHVMYSWGFCTTSTGAISSGNIVAFTPCDVCTSVLKGAVRFPCDSDSSAEYYESEEDCPKATGKKMVDLSDNTCLPADSNREDTDGIVLVRFNNDGDAHSNNAARLAPLFVGAALAFTL